MSKKPFPEMETLANFFLLITFSFIYPNNLSLQEERVEKKKKKKYLGKVSVSGKSDKNMKDLGCVSFLH